MTAQNFAVLGAGIVGLSSAVRLQEEFPKAKVTIIAEKFLKETTSDGSGGLIQASLALIPGVEEALVRKWITDSYSHFSSIVNSCDSSEAGISYLSGYEISVNDEPDTNSVLKNVCFNYNDVQIEETNRIFPSISKQKYASFYTTLLVESRFYLPWLTKKFLSKGGCILSKKLSSISEICNNYTAVINCTGLGSKELLKDEKMTPVRGQVIRVIAPWIKHFYMIDSYDFYIIPGKETCIVGGTHQVGDFDLSVRPEDSKIIWERACNYLPSLKKAVWQWEWVGLRPLRTPIRVESELINNIPVIHNYGHGGNGIALSWGCSKHAVEILKNKLL